MRRQSIADQKTAERKAMLRRLRERKAEIAQHERNMREGEARFPVEEQLALMMQRVIESKVRELAGRVAITWKY